MLIDNVQNKIGELLPFSYRLKGFDVSFNSYVSCVNSADFTSPEEIITFSFKALQQSNRSNSTFQTFEKKRSSKRHELVANLANATNLKDFKIGFQPTSNSKNSHFLLVKLCINCTDDNEYHELSDCFDESSNSSLASIFEEKVFDLICNQVTLIDAANIKFLLDFSTQSTITKTFISMLIKTLNKYGLKADLFVITVSSRLMNSQNIQEIITLQEFVDLGFLICIKEDTFGIESANWLSELPISVVTFQGKTIKKLLRNNVPHKIQDFTSIIEKMKIAIVVENIENPKDFDDLEGFPFNLVGSVKNNVLSDIELKEFIDQRFIDSLVKRQSLNNDLLDGVKS